MHNVNLVDVVFVSPGDPDPLLSSCTAASFSDAAVEGLMSRRGERRSVDARSLYCFGDLERYRGGHDGWIRAARAEEVQKICRCAAISSPQGFGGRDLQLSIVGCIQYASIAAKAQLILPFTPIRS